MKHFQIAASTAAVALIVAAGAGTLAGSWTTSRTGKPIPILMATQASVGSSNVSFQNGFAPVVGRAIHAVVNVSSSKIIRTSGGTISSPFFSDPFFSQLFGNAFPKSFQSRPSVEREHSLGSGVIVNPNGYILTNNHVIDGAKEVKVLLGDKREFEARIIGTDAKTDVAVLKVDAQNLPVLAFGDSSKMEVGNFVLAIGNPFGLNQTVTLGIVSATGRGGLGIEDYEDFIQTDAAINPGNSGGALIDEHGDIIGINTAILSGGGGNQGVGFAIPGNMARNVMDQILKNGKVTRAWLGVSIQSVTSDLARALGLHETYGALINDLDKNGPAAKSGLQVGDVILDVNGQKIEDGPGLQLMIGSMLPGTNVKLTVFRDGATREVTVKLAELPAAAKQSEGDVGAAGGAVAMRGLSVAALTPDIANELKLPGDTKGVIVTSVDPASAASDAGLRRGDVVQQVDRQTVTGVDGFDRAIQSAGGKPVLLLINRNGITSFLVVAAQ